MASNKRKQERARALVKQGLQARDLDTKLNQTSIELEDAKKKIAALMRDLERARYDHDRAELKVTEVEINRDLHSRQHDDLRREIEVAQAANHDLSRELIEARNRERQLLEEERDSKKLRRRIFEAKTLLESQRQEVQRLRRVETVRKSDSPPMASMFAAVTAGMVVGNTIHVLSELQRMSNDEKEIGAHAE